MDPYLEQHWLDVHPTLIVLARAQLQKQLSSTGLVARVEERLIVETPYEDARGFHADVSVAESGAARRARDAGVTVAEPLVLESEIVTQRSIAIIDASGGDVITVIEFLSPSNKTPGEGRKKYQQKQFECLDAGVNLVEIDLVRRGERVTAYPYENLPPTHQTTYLVCVHRGKGNTRFEVYRAPLDAALPTIAIPLRWSDTDATLNLQALVNQTYEDGAYDTIDYSRPCIPALEGADAAFASRLLLSKSAT